jgi:predicted transcriptional regulator
LILNEKKAVKGLVLNMGIIREEAKKVIEKLSDDASWDDVMYQMYVRKKIDEGINSANEGKLLSHEEVKRKFLHNGN